MTAEQAMTAEPPAQPKKRRWPRIRYSLRTLLIATLLAGSGMGLWFRWEPWVSVAKVANTPLNFKRLTTKTKRFAVINNGHLQVWERDSEQKLVELPERADIAEISPNGNALITWNHEDDTKARVCKITGHELELLYKLSTNYEHFRSAVFSPDNTKILILSTSMIDTEFAYKISILEVNSGRLLNWISENNTALAQWFGNWIITYDSGSYNIKGCVNLWSNDLKTKLDELTAEAPLLTQLPFADAFILWYSSKPRRAARVTVENGHFKREELGIFNYFTGTEANYDGSAYIGYDLTEPITSCWDPGTKVVANSRDKIVHRFGYSNPQFCADGKRILTQENNSLVIWEATHPPTWWGIAWLPEFWLALIFGCAFVWSVRRDWRELGKLTGGTQA